MCVRSLLILISQIKLLRTRAVRFALQSLRMRILQICSARTIGGGEKHVASLGTRLTERGQDIFVALAPSSPVRQLLSKIPPDRILELPMRNALSLRSAWKLAQFARANGVQIFHAHLGRDYPLAALAAARSNAQLVLTRHVMFPLGRVHKLTLRRTARVIAVSQAVAKALRSQAIFAPEKIRVIHNGIEVGLFADAKKASAASSRDQLRVGAVGELSSNKSQEDLIRAAKRICAQRDDVEFVIAGEDKSAHGANRKRLEDLVDELELRERVHFAGWADDLVHLLGTFDVFVSASRSESFGMAIVEAMAAGVPVIATETAGAAEIIEENVTGRLVRIADVERLATTIGELLDDENERKRLAQNAQSQARERFSTHRMIEQTERLYKEVLGESTTSVHPL